MILATFSSCCCCSCSCYSFYSKRQLPDGKTPWQWRTEKYQNCAQKLPNVTSETHRKGCDFSYFFLLLLLLLLLLQLLLFKRQLPDGKTQWQWRTEKYQNCAQKLPNVTSETHRKGCDFADFSYFFLLLLLLLLSCNSFYSKDSSRMGKHHGSEGRKSIKMAPKNSLM